MTAAEFVAWAQGYYGPYPAGQRADIAEYLGYLGAAELDELRVQMRDTCPSHIGQVNGYPPDIEAMQRLMPEVRRVIACRQREAREIALASRLLPAPDYCATTEADMMRLDWSAIHAEGLRRRAQAEAARERKPDTILHDFPDRNEQDRTGRAHCAIGHGAQY